MKENNNNNSFINRFTNATSRDITDSFSSKYLSQNKKEGALKNARGVSQLANKKTESKDDFSERRSIKSKSRTVNRRSFTDAAKRSRSDLVYLVRGKDRGKSAWHYVLVDKDKREIFLAKSKTSSIDIADYGEILYSGWGEYPTQAIVDKINEEFGF